MNKLHIAILACLGILVLTVGMAFATSSIGVFIAPTNASIITDSRTMNFEIYLDTPYKNHTANVTTMIQVGLPNGSYIAFGGSGLPNVYNISLINATILPACPNGIKDYCGVWTTNGTHYANASIPMPYDEIDTWFNYTIWANESGAFTNLTHYVNISGPAVLNKGMKVFKVNTITPSPKTTADGDVFGSVKAPVLNMTTNGAVGNITNLCWVTLGLSNGTEYTLDYGTEKTAGSGAIGNFSNKSSSGTVWGNTSVINVDIQSKYESTHNITYRCNATTTGDIFNSSVLTFIVDSIAPSVANTSANIYNDSIYSNGNVITYTANVSDNNTKNASVLIYLPNGTVDTKTMTLSSTDTAREVRVYTVNLTLTDFYDMQNAFGRVHINAMAYDDADNVGYATSNYTYLINKLYSGKWNPISFTENITLTEIASKTTSITYVGIWNPYSGYQNFTTHAIGTSLNANVKINATLNATYIKVSKDILLIRPYYDGLFNDTNQTLYTSSTGSWNLIAPGARVTINSTFFSNAYMNKTTNSYANYLNVTFAGHYTNGTADLWCGTYRGFTKTSCPGITSATTYHDIGSAIWIATNNNLTFNRSALSG